MSTRDHIYRVTFTPFYDSTQRSTKTTAAVSVQLARPCLHGVRIFLAKCLHVE